MERTVRVAVAAVACFLAAGCGGGVQGVAAVEEISTVTTTWDPGPSLDPPEMGEQIFVEVMAGEGLLETFGGRESALRLAHRTCEILAEGVSREQILVELAKTDDPHASGFLFGAAVATICPEEEEG